MTAQKMTKAQAGSLGGKRTAERHGSSYMAAIGRKGAETLHARYSLKPVGTSGWVFVDRETNAIVSTFQNARLDFDLQSKPPKEEPNDENMPF